MKASRALVLERKFNLPMTWASDELLSVMQAELIAELRFLHSRIDEPEKVRNGLKTIEREINWRARGQ